MEKREEWGDIMKTIGIIILLAAVYYGYRYIT